MKKTFFLFLLVASCAFKAQAQLANGYYRVQNTYTDRYISIEDNDPNNYPIKWSTGSVDMSGIKTYKPGQKVSTSPSTIVYISNVSGNQYNIEGQGTSIKKISGGKININLALQSDGSYQAYGQYQGVTLYLKDDSDASKESAYLKPNSKSTKAMNWWAKKVDTSTEYLGIQPDFELNGRYYGTIYASFPFKLVSGGMKAYVASAVSGGYFELKEISGDIPKNTPVIIECSSSSPSGNIILPLSSNAKLSGSNLLTGTFCDRVDSKFMNVTVYDKTTMRVLTKQNGKLAFKKASSSDLTQGAYLKANKAYLVVPANSPDVLVLSSGITPDPDQPVTITAKNYSRVYGDANPTFEYTTSGGTLSGTPEISCEATTTSPVGTYDIIVKKGSVTNEKVTFVNGTLTITKAPLKIKVGNYTKKEGEENPEFTLTYEGFKNNETEAVLTKKPTITCVATKDSSPGEYEIKVSGAEATNYEITYSNGKLLVIDKRPVTITVKDHSRLYGDANPTFEYTTSGGILAGTPEISCEAKANSPVGTYDIIVKKGSVLNDEVTYVNGTLTITKAPLKIKAGNYTKKEGEDNPAFTPTYEGFKNNETEAVLSKKPTITCDATKDSPAGEYEVKVSDAEATNYEITYSNGKLTIRATFTVNGASYTVVDNNTVTLDHADNVEGSFEITEIVQNPNDGQKYTVIAIGKDAFADLSGLTSIYIPATVTSIGKRAFKGCSSLLAIYCYGEEPATLGENAFEGVDKENCIIYVPDGCEGKYSSAEGWKEFANIWTTGIHEIKNEATINDRWYSLDGRSIKKPTKKGIYINNGKKIVIR